MAHYAPQRHTQLAFDVRNHRGQRGVRGAWERRRRRNDASLAGAVLAQSGVMSSGVAVLLLVAPH